MSFEAKISLGEMAGRYRSPCIASVIGFFIAELGNNSGYLTRRHNFRCLEQVRETRKSILLLIFARPDGAQPNLICKKNGVSLSTFCAIVDELAILTFDDKAEKFKKMIEGTNPDLGLVQNYFRLATQSTWADRLPSKSIRFAGRCGIGLAAEAIAPSGVGAALARNNCF